MSETRVVGEEAWYKTAEWCGGSPTRGFGNRYLFIFLDTPTGWTKARPGDQIIKSDDGRFRVERDGELVIEDARSHKKRFTDTELAAEYYHARFDQAIVAIGPRSIMRQRRISNTLHRFATTPHHDGAES